MEAFTPLQRVVIGGINTFKFVEADGILTWPDDDGQLTITENSIVLKSGFDWQDGFADHDTLQYQEGQNYTPNGPVFTAELTGFLPDDLIENALALHHSANKKYVVIFRTHQGTSRIFGSPDDPCIFTFKTTTAKLGQRKGVSFSFKKKTGAQALYT